MSDQNLDGVSERMRADWNARAQEDAHYYVAFGRQKQDEDEFLASGSEQVNAVRYELRRFPAGTNPRAVRALEIGCGPGRLLKPLAGHFGEIHGVDVSDAMIQLARERLAGIPHAHVHATNGATLPQFADESFDLVYSYAVFQHIPSREVVLSYMHEIRRVLKPGGIFRGQFNGLPQSGHQADTWSGARFSAEELRRFTSENGLQLLALEGISTQYMWTTWRRRPVPAGPTGAPRLRRITNAYSSEPLAPARGRFAALSIWIENLPAEADLNGLEIRIADRPGTPVYIGAPEAGLQQVNVLLPAGMPTGLAEVEVRYEGRGLSPPAYVRLIPPGPQVPRILSVTDGINLLSENRSETGTLKITLEEISDPNGLAARIDEEPVTQPEIFCTDPLTQRYELNCRIPEPIQPGEHDLSVRLHRRCLGSVKIRVSPEN